MFLVHHLNLPPSPKNVVQCQKESCHIREVMESESFVPLGNFELDLQMFCIAFELYV